MIIHHVDTYGSASVFSRALYYLSSTIAHNVTQEASRITVTFIGILCFCFNCWHECEHVGDACTKSAVGYLLCFLAEFIEKPQAMHFPRRCWYTYINIAQVAALDPTPKHDC